MPGLVSYLTVPCHAHDRFQLDRRTTLVKQRKGNVKLSIANCVWLLIGYRGENCDDCALASHL
jgi:hypothetical protein